MRDRARKSGSYDRPLKLRLITHRSVHTAKLKGDLAFRSAGTELQSEEATLHPVKLVKGLVLTR